VTNTFAVPDPADPNKVIRIWMHVSDRDILITRDNYHDWVFANERMAKALAAKGYPYQFVFAKERYALRPRRKGTDPASGIGVCVPGIRAENVNRPREVRAYGLTRGIGGAHAAGSRLCGRNLR